MAAPMFSSPSYAGGISAPVATTFMARVYQWMALGLGTTAATALVVQSQLDLVRIIFRTPLQWILMIAIVALPVSIGGAVHKMSLPVASAVFFAYAALMGVALAPVFLVYTGASIGTTFAITAAMFGSMSIFGLVTKRDLSGWGHFLMMGLIGVCVAGLISLFLPLAGPLYWLMTFVGVIVFTGLAAYDTQRIKEMASQNAFAPQGQLAILGATMLYLDFVNLFMFLLRLFGNRRSDR